MLSFNFEREIRPPAAQTLISVSDGDTPNIRQPVRMVSADTPEKTHYAGRPELAQPKLDVCHQRLLAGFYPQIPDGLRDYLVDRLDGGAAARHIAAGEEASLQFNLLLMNRLARLDGSQRPVATVPTGEIIDRYADARLPRPLVRRHPRRPLPSKTNPLGAPSTSTWWPPRRDRGPRTG